MNEATKALPDSGPIRANPVIEEFPTVMMFTGVSVHSTNDPGTDVFKPHEDSSPRVLTESPSFHSSPKMSSRSKQGSGSKQLSDLDQRKSTPGIALSPAMLAMPTPLVPPGLSPTDSAKTPETRPGTLPESVVESPKFRMLQSLARKTSRMMTALQHVPPPPLPQPLSPLQVMGFSLL